MNLTTPPPTLFHPLETLFSPASEPEQESLSLISLIHTHTLSLSLPLHQPGMLQICRVHYVLMPPARVCMKLHPWPLVTVSRLMGVFIGC